MIWGNEGGYLTDLSIHGRLERRVKALGADADDTSKEKGGLDKLGIEQNVPGTNMHAAAGK